MQPRTPLSPGVPRQAARGRGANDSNAAPSEPRCGSNDGSMVTTPHTHAHRRQSRPPLAPALSADLGQSVFIESLSATTSAPTLTKHRAKYAKPKAKPKPKQKNKPTKKPEKRVRKTGSAMSVTNAYPSPSSPPPHPFVTYRLQETVGQAVQDRQGNSLLTSTHPSLILRVAISLYPRVAHPDVHGGRPVLPPLLGRLPKAKRANEKLIHIV